MRSSGRLSKRFTWAWAGLAAGPVLAAVVTCLAGGWIVDSLHLRHQRAFQQWNQHRPYHYQYRLALLGTVTYQNYLVEVVDGNLVKLTDLGTGVSTSIPSAASTSFLFTNAWVRSNLLIDDLFMHIQSATRPPRSPTAFVGRANPSLYFRLVDHGWLERGLPSCDPAYPQVRYDPRYGFPADLHLAGDPCSTLAEQSSPVHLQIEAFQPLP